MPEENPQKILDFWKAIGPRAWFAKIDAIDERVRAEFGDAHRQAADGKLDHWRDRPNSCLALIIVLDQFSRNLHRDSPRAFAQDEKARSAADLAARNAYHEHVDPHLAMFMYMPFRHSESIVDQDRSLCLMHMIGPLENIRYGRHHRSIIARFGRFPHRNRLLGRHTTPAERKFLEAGGFGG